MCRQTPNARDGFVSAVHERFRPRPGPERIGASEAAASSWASDGALGRLAYAKRPDRRARGSEIRPLRPSRTGARERPEERDSPSPHLSSPLLASTSFCHAPRTASRSRGIGPEAHAPSISARGLKLPGPGRPSALDPSHSGPGSRHRDRWRRTAHPRVGGLDDPCSALSHLALLLRSSLLPSLLASAGRRRSRLRPRAAAWSAIGLTRARRSCYAGHARPFVQGIHSPPSTLPDAHGDRGDLGRWARDLGLLLVPHLHAREPS